MAKGQLRAQYEQQLVRARVCLPFYAARSCALWMVRYPKALGLPTRISIVGTSISNALPEIWKAGGAQVRKLCTIPNPRYR